MVLDYRCAFNFGYELEMEEEVDLKSKFHFLLEGAQQIERVEP